MPDRSIILRAEEVRAILDGRKAAHRVVLKPQPDFRGGYGEQDDPEVWGWEDENGDHIAVTEVRLPFAPEDRLYVRETWALPHGFDLAPATVSILALLDEKGHAPVYKATDNPNSYAWRSPATMPRWASRLTLIVDSVKVQRVRDVTEEEAREEGGEALIGDAYPRIPSYRHGLQDRWDARHGAGAWERNDWTARATFRAVHRNIDAAT